MARLYILRHAKSSWAEPGNTDFSRTLNDRGISDLPKIARKIKQKSWLPDHIYCSAANRTRLTIDLIGENLPELTKNIDYLDKLYSGSLEGYLETLRGHKNGTDNLMLVGHNPTCESLAMYLAKDGDEKAIKTLDYKFPTGALAVLDLAIENWRDIGENCGYLNAFSVPRDMV